MAIQKTYTKELYGEEIVFNDAYHRIYSVTTTHEKIVVNVDIYRNNQKEHLLDSVSYIFLTNDYSGADIIQIGYGLLKTLDFYNGAVNIFEEGQPVKELLKVK